MEMQMTVVLAFLVAHWGYITFAVGYILTAVVATMPAKRPTTLDEYWQWAYDAGHMMLNSRGNRIPNAQSEGAPR
jgi:hypothetical protein